MSVATPRLLKPTWALTCVISLISPAFAGSAASRDVTTLPGASIVEKISAAIKDCASKPCEIYIPAGTYTASPISTWKKNPTTTINTGIDLPSNVELRGAGIGHTIIEVTRATADPSATLFASVNSSNVRLREMTIHWTDSANSYDWVSIFICHHCAALELDHLNLEGNPNKLVNLLDSTNFTVHDNTFLLHSTGYGHGDNALGISRFDPSASLSASAGVVRDNRFTQTGEYRTSSMLIVAQSGLDVHSNIFEAHFPPPANATGIESGQDNLLRLPENVKISANIFHGASIAYGGLNNSELTNNFFDRGDIYIALQSGTTASLSGLTIADNELHNGSISIGGLEHTSTAHFSVARNRVFDGNIGTGNSALIQDIEVSNNEVRYSSNKSGIDCNACSLIRDNVVREIGQNAPGDLHAGYLIAGRVQDVSNNVYLDDQHEYNTGSICSVATPTSTTCLSPSSKSATSRWILLRGGEWGTGWSNRHLYVGAQSFPIRAFATRTLIELEENEPALPPETKYYLYRTTFNAFELNNATIERFANNLAIATAGFLHAAVQEDGTIAIRNMSGNVFRPYTCFGKCTPDYRSTTDLK